MTPDEVPERAGHVGAEICYRIQPAGASFAAGRQPAFAEMAPQWARAARAVTEPVSGRRRGPGGRAHFTDPRPGGFPGRGAKRQAEREAQHEMEEIA
jgi:hypothetical protein